MTRVKPLINTPSVGGLSTRDFAAVLWQQNCYDARRNLNANDFAAVYFFSDDTDSDSDESDSDENDSDESDSDDDNGGQDGSKGAGGAESGPAGQQNKRWAQLQVAVLSEPVLAVLDRMSVSFGVPPQDGLRQ